VSVHVGDFVSSKKNTKGWIVVSSVTDWCFETRHISTNDLREGSLLSS